MAGDSAITFKTPLSAIRLFLIELCFWARGDRRGGGIYQDYRRYCNGTVGAIAREKADVYFFFNTENRSGLRGRV